jgi:hypothetical protein
MPLIMPGFPGSSPRGRGRCGTGGEDWSGGFLLLLLLLLLLCLGLDHLREGDWTIFSDF